MTRSTTTTTPKAGNVTTNAATNKTARDPAQLRALTEKLAYELWEKKGRKHGQHDQDWAEAEKVAKQRLGWT